MTHCDPLQRDPSCGPVKSCAIAWAKPWPSMSGRQSRTEGSSDLPAPCTKLPTAFQQRAPSSHTHIDTAHHPQSLQLHLIAIYLPILLVVIPKIAVVSDTQLSGETKLRVSFGNSVALSRALKNGAGNLLINFLTRFLATFVSCPSWKCYENIFSWGILSLAVPDSKWKTFILTSERLKKTV